MYIYIYIYIYIHMHKATHDTYRSRTLGVFTDAAARMGPPGTRRSRPGRLRAAGRPPWWRRPRLGGSANGKCPDITWQQSCALLFLFVCFFSASFLSPLKYQSAIMFASSPTSVQQFDAEAQ